MRIYDARVARFLSIDPLTKNYPHYTPYSYAGNKPIRFIDLDGAEEADYVLANQKLEDLRETNPAEYTRLKKVEGKILLLELGLVGGGVTLAGGLSLEGISFSSLLKAAFKTGVVGAGTNTAITYLKGGDNYELAKAATSGFFSGAVLGVTGGGSISSILTAGGFSGGIGEVTNELFDKEFGNVEGGYSLQKILISSGIGAVANLISTKLVDRLLQAVDNQVSKSIAATKTNEYRNIIRKAILEKSPNLKGKQLQDAINADIKTSQNALKRQGQANKAALTTAIERAVDIGSDKASSSLEDQKRNDK